MKVIRILLIIPIVTGSVVLFGPCVHDTALNSRRLHQFEKGIMSVDHPFDTELIASRARVGLLIGSGNHCDYFVGELRSYRGPKEALVANYSNQSVHNPVTGRAEKLTLVFLEDGVIPRNAYLPDSLKHLEAWGEDCRSVPLQSYLVYLFRSYQANADVRCH